MAKFLKSLFQPSDKKRKSQLTEGTEDRSDFAPPLDGRRKLSISRSGRMKQNKKRQSLSLDLYGENLQPNEVNSSREYHVHGKSLHQNAKENNENETKKANLKEIDQNLKDQRKLSIDLKTPEGIDRIFKISDHNT